MDNELFDIEESRDPNAPEPYFPVEGMTVEPMGLPLMEAGWQGLVAHLAGEGWALDAFTKDTGHVPLPLGRTPIERMVDQAAGVHAETFAKFCDWVTDRHWGVKGRDEDKEEDE